MSVLNKFRHRIGSDPEAFVLIGQPSGAKKLGLPNTMLGQAVPGYYALGKRAVDVDAKSNAYRAVPISHGAVIEDGMAVEWTITPTTSMHDFVEYMSANISDVRDIVQNTCKGVLSVAPRIQVEQRFIDELDQTYGTACSLQIFGCSPDYSIYENRPTERPSARTYPYRTSGGHIHVEAPNVAKDRNAFAYMVAALDRVLGTAGTFLCTSEAAYERKKLYGQAGAIRSYEDRIEYRTLPAQALIQAPDLCYNMVYAAQNIAAWFEMVLQQSSSQVAAISTYQEVLGDYELLEKVAHAINSHDVDACRAYHNEFGMSAPADMEIGMLTRSFNRYRMPNDFELHW